MNKDTSEYDVNVFGGGASGIYASMILKKNWLRP
jgi:ribulose 1,5-bisphosphate synthetase/thiazole synthase